MEVNNWLSTEIGIDIWKKKYCHDNESLSDWFERVSGGNQDVRQLIEDKKFLFGGRILASRGLGKKGRKITYSNCYVLKPPEDDLESIFNTAKELARTYSYGGGCGVDLSKLSPKGAAINNAANETSGSVSFMELYNTTTSLIGQNGRRGALMLSLDCSHPDVEEFIKIKSDTDKINKANISVRINDEFMKAVESDLEWNLHFYREQTKDNIKKTIKAKKLFELLSKMNWDYAEPGILNWDRIKTWSLLSEDESFNFAGVNPCAEEPLPEYGSCLLGSINLSEFAIDKFTPNAKFNFESFESAVHIGVVALNEVLHEGMDLHPLAGQRECVNQWRQIGLGLFGWHDLLIKLGIKFGSKESIELSHKIGHVFANAALQSSAGLTAKYGKYPEYDENAIFKSAYFQHVATEETKNIVKNLGLANSQILTIPPTGSIGTMLGVSTALEPIYSISYNRKTESLNDKDTYYKIYTPIIKELMEVIKIKDEKELPQYISTSMDIDYKDRILSQSVWQQYIDASISSTINVPNSFSVVDVMDLYMQSWKCGLKGVTIFRDGCARTGVLSTDSNENKHTPIKYDSVSPISRKTIGTTHGSTYCKQCACGTLYITCNKDVDGNVVESFVHTSKGGICQANIGAMNRMISLSLRSGVKIGEIIDQLKGINCPACVKVSSKGDKLDGISCPDIISKTLLNFANNLDSSENNPTSKISETKKIACPDCGEPVNFDGGCFYCMSCGYSKCE